MDQDKSTQISSCLKDMTNLMQKLVVFSKDTLLQFSETGLLTVETKKDFDALIFECERIQKQAESLLNVQEPSM